jgi:hypothetical protein
MSNIYQIIPYGGNSFYISAIDINYGIKKVLINNNIGNVKIEEYQTDLFQKIIDLDKNFMSKFLAILPSNDITICVSSKTY